MSTLISGLLKSCFPPNTYQRVNVHSKKDDDFGNEAISKWISNFPAEEDMETWETTKINIYVKHLFKDLPVSQICDANGDEVKTHIVKVASRCERAFNAVLDQWEKTKFNTPDFKKNIGRSLAFTTWKG